MNKPNLILVDRKDREIGIGEKISVHKKGLLHRAISVYIFNPKGQIMMQQRAKVKYHSPLRWSNTCCTNCYVGESAIQSAHRSLKTEMGFDCGLTEAFTIIYKADVGNGMIEHEFLHVFFGRRTRNPRINPNEVNDWKWMNLDEIDNDIKINGNDYSEWLKLLIKGKLHGRIRRFAKSGKAK